MMTYTKEVWQPAKSEQTRINRIMDNIIKKNHNGATKYTKESSMHRDCVAGFRDNQRENRIMMEHRLANNNPRMKRLIGTSHEKSCRETTYTIKNNASIEEDMQGKKLTVKKKKWSENK